MNLHEDLFDGVIGGGEAARVSEVLSSDSSGRQTVFAGEVDRKIMRIMALHPELVKFRNSNLSELDESTKSLLLVDLYEVLGLTPIGDETY